MERVNCPSCHGAGLIALSGRTQKVLDAVREMGRATVAEIVERFGLHPEAAYGELERLHLYGLLASAVEGDCYAWRPVAVAQSSAA